MLHGRHDRKSNAVAQDANSPILGDHHEFGKTIGTAARRDQSVFKRSGHRFA
jgi:hypothetical protein